MGRSRGSVGTAPSSSRAGSSSRRRPTASRTGGADGAGRPRRGVVDENGSALVVEAHHHDVVVARAAQVPGHDEGPALADEVPQVCHVAAVGHGLEAARRGRTRRGGSRRCRAARGARARAPRRRGRRPRSSSAAPSSGRPRRTCPCAGRRKARSGWKRRGRGGEAPSTDHPAGPVASATPLVQRLQILG